MNMIEDESPAEEIAREERSERNEQHPRDEE
jgi:hypothetical protein